MNWIKTTEEKPCSQEKILFIDKEDLEIHLGFYNHLDMKWYIEIAFAQIGLSDEKVSHWLYVPALPKE